MEKTKIILDENDIPRKWYNILPDMPTSLSPPLNPETKEPIGPKDLSAIFPMELIKQEMSQERFISIPEEVREIYKYGVLLHFTGRIILKLHLKRRQKYFINMKA